MRREGINFILIVIDQLDKLDSRVSNRNIVISSGLFHVYAMFDVIHSHDN